MTLRAGGDVRDLSRVRFRTCQECMVGRFGSFRVLKRHNRKTRRRLAASPPIIAPPTGIGPKPPSGVTGAGIAGLLILNKERLLRGAESRWRDDNDVREWLSWLFLPCRIV